MKKSFHWQLLSDRPAELLLETGVVSDKGFAVCDVHVFNVHVTTPLPSLEFQRFSWE